MDFRLLHSAFPFPCIAVHGALSDPRVGPIRHARNTGRAVGTAMHATSMAYWGAVVRAGRQAPASGSSSRAPGPPERLQGDDDGDGRRMGGHDASGRGARRGARHERRY